MAAKTETPLMRQYEHTKAKFPDTVLLFRVGDFYETFNDDAKIASRVLGITLTKRSNGAAAETPLAGFPHHALETYLPKLVQAGFKVAVCDQLEDPALARGIVKRGVTEVVTPGVTFSDRLLDHKRNTYLAAVVWKDPLVGVAFVDASTGEFQATEIHGRDLKEVLETIQPAEVLVPKRERKRAQSELKGLLLSERDDWIFGSDFGFETLTRHFQTHSLKGFGIDGLPLGVAAAGAVLHYLEETQQGKLPHIRKLTRFHAGDYIALDPSTKRNLELTSSMQTGGKDGTLVSILDRTRTAMGGRLFKKWVSRPLKKLDAIEKRLEAVAELVERSRLRSGLGEALANVGDLERLIAKISMGRATPRDLMFLRLTLQQLPALKDLLREAEGDTLARLREGLDLLPHVTDRLVRTLVDEPSASLADGGVIRPGFSAELDELRTLSSDGKDWIANLQATERERTGIGSLKVQFNKVFGYYIEISNAHQSKAPPEYIRKQTLVNAERYVTPELKTYEEKVLGAQERMLALETSLFSELRIILAEEAEKIQRNAQLLALLDCLVSLADAADAYGYCRPTVHDGTSIRIVAGRHPVIERLLPPGEVYVPNDVLLDTEAEQIHLITGPNMAGKSSFLRQVGLIVLLAQIGSFVPAHAAEIGLVDKIFTRVGASDNLAAGESTFLVEMNEAAAILHNATPRSLILLDEIGRGTSTYDGLSIAWALAEHLHNTPPVAARTLFATHYHELNALAETHPRIANYNVEVREVADRVIFLRKIVPGGADHSYGIQVARMAGLPTPLIRRAQAILKTLEGDRNTPSTADRLAHLPELDEQPSLFGPPAAFGGPDPAMPTAPHPVVLALRTLDVNRLTPIEALLKLNELQQDAG